MTDGFTEMKTALSDIGKRIVIVEKYNGIIKEVFEDETWYIWIPMIIATNKNVENDNQLEKSYIDEHQNSMQKIRQVQEKFDDEKDKEQSKYNLIFCNIIESLSFNDWS